MALSTFACGRLWGARSGTGAPWALALHGWGRDHRDFAPVLAGADALALDLPGFGVAPEPPSAWSSRDYAEWVAPVLEEMAAGPVVVVGHSFGARVAVRLAELAPARVGALVLVGAPLAPAPGAGKVRPAFSYRAARALHRAGLVGEARMEELRQRHGSDDYRRASATMRGVLVKAVAETASSAYLGVLRRWVPAGGALELVWGEHDAVASLAGLLEALARPPRVPAKVTVVRGAGHLISAEVAEALRAAVLGHAPLGARPN
jgi:pimeloyl-ACP methyl ester carboxylesterase